MKCSVDEEAERSDKDMGFCLFGGETPPAPIALSKSLMNISYMVEALTTVPSNGVSYKVLVAIIPYEAVITHVTTPHKSPIAYLQVKTSGQVSS